MKSLGNAVVTDGDGLEISMRAFITGVTAAVVIAIVAALVLSRMPHDASDVHQSPQGNVRL